MDIKHSKLRNTSILFELLVKKITSDTLSNKDSEAINILKKYFVNTEMGKEYKLCETLFKSHNSSEAEANIILSTVLEASKKLNKKTLRKEKYNLVKELKENFNLDEIFKTKIQNYKTHASIYTLFEIYGNKDFPNVDPKQLITNKLTLLEYLTKSPLGDNKKDDIMEEFKTYDKSTRLLTQKILLEKFNKKHDHLNLRQKTILKEYITSVDSTPRLKTFYNNEVKYLKDNFKIQILLIEDKIIKIKLNEVVKFLKEICKNKNIKSDNLVDLLQFHNLLDEVIKVNG